MKKILTVIFAVLLLIGNFHPVYTEEIDDDSQTVLETHDLDPETLHVEKLGETDEEEPVYEMEPYSLDDLVRVSIVLDGDATLDAGFSASTYATDAEAKSYRESLRQQQEALTSRIEEKIGSSLNVKWNLTLAVNIISAELKYKDIVKVKEIEGVKDVFIENRYEAYQDDAADPQTSNTSTYMVGATQSWDLGYTGAGMKVAIIDTGIDTTHQSFNADAYQHAISTLDKTVEQMGQISSSLANELNSRSRNYVSAKIPYAYNYVDNNTTVDHMSDTEGEHGSHVAGIAAANRFIKSGSSYVDAADTVKAVGMAPDAQLLVMKVFGASGGAYDSDYMSAIEDAIVLGADSVNLSLGSSTQGFTYTNAYQDTLNRLAEEDIKLVVTISAGNNYDLAYELNTDLYIDDISTHTGGSPGTYINSLCVAAAQNTGVTGTPLTFNGNQEVFYTETSSTGAAMASIAGSYNYVYIDAVGQVADYSAVNSAASLSGKIVIVNRGTNSFYEKGNNVINYSPKALIVANNQAGTISMGLDDYTGTFPMVSITLADANTLKANSTAHTTGSYTYYTGTVYVSNVIVTDVLQEYEDAEITDFSSWGVPGSLLMKPEITAPGGDIYSVFGTNKTKKGTAGGSDQYELMSGTSMAAPHMAGLSAVLMQYLSENDISVDGYSQRALNQSLLMSTAVPMKNDGEYLSILQQGSGLVDVSKAITATSVIMMNENDDTLTALTGAAADGKVKAELGDNPSKVEPYRFSFTIYNTNSQTVFYDLNTELFTQAFYEEDGEVFMSRQTSGALINTWNKTYRWYDVDNTPSYDVNSDGTTDGEDVQAILDYVIAEEAEIAYSGSFDEQIADFDQNGKIESADAYQLLDWINDDKAYADGEIPANSSRKVEVVITPNDSLDAYYPSGAYVEGFTYVSTQTTTNDGAVIDVVHSIPILGFYGSWTDPSMFNNVSYVDTLYGSEQTSYTGNVSNYLTIQYSGVNTKFSGNPYKVEDEFPTDRLAVSSNSLLSNVHYNLIRAASATGFAVSKTDGLNGDVTEILNSSIVNTNVSGIWFSQTQASWQNMNEKFYSINKTAASYGLSEGDTFRIGFYAIPEYNAMTNAVEHGIALTDASATVMSASRFREIILSNKLGSGAYVGYDFVVDDTHPQIDDPVLDGSSLTVHASDDRALAYLAVLSLDGEVIYAETTPAKAEETITFDASDAIANARGYVAVFAGDYAGNEVAKAIKVNDNTHVEKTVYVLTDTLTAGQDYLIVSKNAVGSAYALSHSNASVATNPVSVKAGINETDNAPYIESVDVADTSIFTVSSGYKFQNGNYYLYRNGGSTLIFSTSSGSNSSWTWDGTNHTLSGNSRYLRFYNNTFSLNSAVNSVYLYKKTIIVTEVDPYGIDSVSVTPGSLDLYKGNEADLVAKVLPLTATDHSVTWSSSNSNVASVDEHGHVTTHTAGSAIITATSNQDDKYSASCDVSVTSVSKTLNGIVWDEQGGVYFSNFNPSSLPSYNKLHDSPVGKELVSALMYSSNSLYAGTLDTSAAETVIYSVNRNNYTVTEYGTNYLFATDMAIAASNSTYQNYIGFAYTFGPYLVAGPIAPGDDGEGGTYCGLPYAATDISATTGDAYLAGIATKTRSSSGGDFYVLDENGVIWTTTLSLKNNSFSFSTPTKFVDTGIATSFLYQSLYYDGTYIYWSHFEGSVSELIIINASTGAVYRVGDFGAEIWPVGGIYVNGSVAPASVDDEIMDAADLEGLKPVLSREEVMNSEIMDRFYEEAERMATKKVQASSDEAQEPAVEDEETVEVPEEPVVEEPVAPEEDPEDAGGSENEDLEPVEDDPVIEDAANESVGTLNRVNILNSAEKKNEVYRKQQLTNISLLKPLGANSDAQGEGSEVTIALTEDNKANNGLYVVNYDPAILAFDSRNSAADYTSFYDDENGKVYLSFADYEGIEAGENIEELIFSRLSEAATQVVVNTIELNFNAAGDGEEYINQRTIEIQDAYTSAVRVASCSLTTGGDIGVNFYLTIPDETAEHAYVSFLFQGDTTTYKVSPSQLTSGGYRYTVNTTSKDMRDPIVLTVHDEEGQPIRLLSASGKTDYTDGYTYSVSRYFELARRNYTGVAGMEKLLALVDTMDTYGMYAQILFNYNAEGLEPADVSDITQDDVEQYKNVRTGTVPAGLIYAGSTLVLDSTICYRHYFTVGEGHDISEYTFTINGTPVQTIKNGSRYYVEVSNIAANDLEQMSTTLITGGTDTYSIAYCGLSYARAAIRNNYNEANLCRAMYKYYLAAEDYFN